VELVLLTQSRCTSPFQPTGLVGEVHNKAKGRQWNRVALGSDFLPPSVIRSRMQRNPSRGLQEEIHLLYVAVTGARDELYLPPGLYTELVRG